MFLIGLRSIQNVCVLIFVVIMIFELKRLYRLYYVSFTGFCLCVVMVVNEGDTVFSGLLGADLWLFQTKIYSEIKVY